MKTQLKLNTCEYILERYPKTPNKSLQAWSNAELLALDFIKDKKPSVIHLFNDRFGVWNCTLNANKIVTIWTYASQKKAILQNLALNNFPTNVQFKTPLEVLDQVELVLLKIPKSLELFELFLAQIHKTSSSKTEVVCCFITKYFTTSYIKIASKYFENIEQTKAWKKARLLILKQPKKGISENSYINQINWKNNFLQQYYGVFSSNKIDIGTQFFLEHLKVQKEEMNILDVASGNGIIAFEVVKQNPKANVTLIDDFNLAIASSKINLKNFNADFICDDNLQNIPKNHYDLVVSNPPFHFEHENNIEVTLSLFKGVKDCLHSKGRFMLVANKHLNYKTHLNKLFPLVKELVSNKKFVVYSCFKEKTF